MAKELKCPNCGAAVVKKEDGSYVCTDQGCGGTFTFKEAEAKLTGVGEYELLKGKVEKHDADLVAIRELLGKNDPPAEADEEPEQDQEESEDNEHDEEEEW